MAWNTRLQHKLQYSYDPYCLVVMRTIAAAYGTHSMGRTKATLIYRRTKNLRAVQLLLGHTKLESTVRYPGIEVDDALETADQTAVSHWAGQRPYPGTTGRLPATTGR